MPSRTELRQSTRRNQLSDTPSLDDNLKNKLRQAYTFEAIIDVLVPAVWHNILKHKGDLPPLTPSLLLAWMRDLAIVPSLVHPPPVDEGEDDLDKEGFELLNSIQSNREGETTPMHNWQVEVWKCGYKMIKALDMDTRIDMPHSNFPTMFDSVFTIMGLRTLTADAEPFEQLFTTSFTLVHMLWVLSGNQT